MPSGVGITFARTTSLSSIRATVFKSFGRAISVEQFVGTPLITGNKFSGNQFAIYVESTADADPFWGNLPCVPPFTSFLVAPGNYFGRFGMPGLYLNPSEYVGLAVPTEFGTLYTASSALLSNSTGYSGSTLGADAVNWAMYSCPVLPTPPFPVFPVKWLPSLSVDPFPTS